MNSKQNRVWNKKIKKKSQWFVMWFDPLTPLGLWWIPGQWIERSLRERQLCSTGICGSINVKGNVTMTVEGTERSCSLQIISSCLWSTNHLPVCWPAKTFPLILKWKVSGRINNKKITFPSFQLQRKELKLLRSHCKYGPYYVSLSALKCENLQYKVQLSYFFKVESEEFNHPESKHKEITSRFKFEVSSAKESPNFDFQTLLWQQWIACRQNNNSVCWLIAVSSRC